MFHKTQRIHKFRLQTCFPSASFLAAGVANIWSPPAEERRGAREGLEAASSEEGGGGGGDTSFFGAGGASFPALSSALPVLPADGL